MNLRGLRTVLLMVAFLAFLAFYFFFLRAIVIAPDGNPPLLDERLVNLAAIFSGGLGSAFAVALWIETTSDENVRRFVLGSLTEKTLLKLGLYLYALVGLVSLVVYVTNLDETPGSMSALALVFAGYLGALISNAYKGVLQP